MDIRMFPTAYNQIGYCHTTTDMPSAAVPFPFGDCKVCNDKATGVHYGVTTCEGCKGFFKRSITKGEKYKCFFGGQCILSPQNRNRCKSCRYKRCLNAGMSIEAVKMGRIPKVDKERALEEHRRKEEEKIRAVISGEEPFCSPSIGLDLSDPGFGSTDLVGNSLLSDSFNSDSLFSTSPASSSARMTGSNHRESNGCLQNNDTMKDLINQMMESGNEGTVPQAMWRKFMMSIVNGQQNMMPAPVRNGGVSRSCAMYSQVNQSMNPTSTTLDVPYDPTPYSPLKRPTIPYSNDEIPPQKQQRAVNPPRNMSHKSDVQDMYMDEPFDMDISSTVESYSDIHNDVFGSPDVFDNSLPLQPHNENLVKTASSQNLDHRHGHPGMSSTQSNGFVNRKGFAPPHTQAFNSGESTSHADSTVNSQANSTPMDIFDQEFHIKNEFDQYLFPDKPDILLNDDFLESSNSFLMKTEKNVEKTDSQTSEQPKDHSGPCPVTESMSPSKETDRVDYDIPHFKKDSETEISEMKRTVGLLTEAEKRHNFDTKRQMQQMIDEIEGKENVHPWNKITVATKEQVKQVWDQLFAAIPECNARILGFCRSVPGFRDINPEDQEILMQYAYFDIWLISCAPLFHKGDTFMRFPNGARYSRWWMEKFLPNNLIDEMHTFCNQLHECSPSDSEIAIICAIRLTAPDRPGLSDSSKVKKLHSHLLDVLAHEVSNNHKSNAGRILIDIIRILPMLTSLNEEQSRTIGNFKIDEIPEKAYEEIQNGV